MIRFELAFGLVVLVLWIYCLVEVIASRDGEARNLPKLWWIILVLLFPLAGSVAWLVAGRPHGAGRASRDSRSAPEFPEYDRPGRAAAADPAKDEEFLRQVRERAERQREAYREEQRQRREGEQQ